VVAPSTGPGNTRIRPSGGMQIVGLTAGDTTGE
jgi:hypothetical protein